MLGWLEKFALLGLKIEYLQGKLGQTELEEY